MPVAASDPVPRVTEHPAARARDTPLEHATHRLSFDRRSTQGANKAEETSCRGYAPSARCACAWIDTAEITTGPVFRRVTRTGAVCPPLTAQSVALIIKQRVQAAGVDPREFVGPGLRSGYVTQAARDWHHPTQIAATTRHQDQRVLVGYTSKPAAARGAPRTCYDADGINNPARTTRCTSVCPDALVPTDSSATPSNLGHAGPRAEPAARLPSLVSGSPI